MRVHEITATIFLSLLLALSCKEEAQEIFASSVVLNETSVDVPIGQTLHLSATVLPENTTNKTIIWSSSDESVVKVKDGAVSAIKIGKANVKATCGNKSATCTVNVTPIYVEGITLNAKESSLKVGETISLTATVKPENATDKSINWSSSDEEIVTVKDGVVAAVKIGSATIIAKAGEKTATCAITVVATPVTSITLNKTSASLKAGETVTLTATVKPDDATDKTVTWTTSDASVATVDNGVVTAKKVSSATITAKAGDKSATCAITVVATPVTSITLDRTSASLRAGETVTLTASVKPDDATDKTVTWTTSDASVATVSNGVVTAVKVGTTIITAKAGDQSAKCTITVIATPVTSVTLDRTSASLKVGETVTLTATVKPDDATYKTVAWTTSDASVVTVDNGVVTAIKLGSATIIAKVGEKMATCSITVIPTPVTSVTLNMTGTSLKVGETAILIATVKPDDATDKTVTWSTTDANVAMVDNGGVVTAIKVGTATITAKAGDKTASCSITVVPTPVTSISLDITSASLKAGETVSLTATVKPDDATDKTVTWSSTDTSVATVSNGVVTAIKLGSTTIIAKAGDKTATCFVTVLSNLSNDSTENTTEEDLF